MSRIVIVILTYHRYKPTDHINIGSICHMELLAWQFSSFKNE
jgi:hypothetical protein